nr:hypothetical protein [uncultured Anaerobutyricum sp.]
MIYIIKMPIEQIAQVVKVTAEVVQNWIGESVIAAKDRKSGTFIM